MERLQLSRKRCIGHAPCEGPQVVGAWGSSAGRFTDASRTRTSGGNTAALRRLQRLVELYGLFRTDLDTKEWRTLLGSAETIDLGSESCRAG